MTQMRIWCAAFILSGLAGPLVAEEAAGGKSQAVSEGVSKAWEAIQPSLLVCEATISQQVFRGGPGGFRPSASVQQAVLNGLVVANGYALIPDVGARKDVKKVVVWLDGQESPAELVVRDPQLGLALLKIPEGKGRPWAMKPATVHPGDQGFLMTKDEKERQFGPVILPVSVVRQWRGVQGEQAQLSGGLQLAGSTFSGGGAVVVTAEGALQAYATGRTTWVADGHFWSAVQYLLAKKSDPDDEDGEPVVGATWLGIMFDSLTEPFAEAAGLPNAKGARINRVLTGSPAHQAGLAAGDIVTAMNREPLTQEAQGAVLEVQSRLSRERPGNALQLNVWRDRKDQAMSVTLIKRPKPKTMQLEELGLQVQELPVWQKELLGMEEAVGVLVGAITPGGPAALAGLGQRADAQPVSMVLTDFYGKTLSSWDDFQKAVTAMRSDKANKVLVKGVKGAYLGGFLTEIDMSVGSKRPGSGDGPPEGEGGNN